MITLQEIEQARQQDAEARAAELAAHPATIAEKQLRSIEIDGLSETDNHLVHHLWTLHVERNKPFEEMWECFRVRLDALWNAQQPTEATI